MSEGTQPFDPARYRMTIRGRRGMPMRPMTFRVDPPPFPGESLLGLVSRSAARNGFAALSKVVRFADHARGVPSTIVSADQDLAARLAFVMKLRVEEVTSRLHPVVDRPGLAGEFVDFFGVPIRSIFRESQVRRVSPRALAVSPHHRAIHDLRPFSFCPETLEQLIDECPVCRRPLDWFLTRGVEWCARCVDDDEMPTVDLRDHPQPLVDIEDVDGARLLAGLVDPDPDRRRAAMARVDPALRDQQPGDLFDLAMSLGFAMATSPESGNLTLRTAKNGGIALITPDTIGRLGRVMMEWSKGFSEVADTMRSLAPLRKGKLGLHKEIGPLHLLTSRKSLPVGIREIVSEAIQADFKRTAHQHGAARNGALRFRDDLVDVRTAAQILGVSHKLVGKLRREGVLLGSQVGKRGLTTMPREEIEALRVVRRDMIDGTKAARAVGLPLEALEVLAAAGTIERVEGPVLAMVAGSFHFRQSGLDAYVAKLMAVRERGTAPESARPFDAAIRRLPAGEKPWLAILSGIEHGTLRTFAADARGPAFLGTLVDEPALTALVGAAEPSEEPGGELPISYREAANLLGVSAPTVTWMVAAGVLGTTGEHDRRITRDAIARFNREYAHTTEVARYLGVGTIKVKRTMAERGIQPAAALHKGMRLIWRRSEVFD